MVAPEAEGIAGHRIPGTAVFNWKLLFTGSGSHKMWIVLDGLPGQESLTRSTSLWRIGLYKRSRQSSSIMILYSREIKSIYFRCLLKVV